MARRIVSLVVALGLVAIVTGSVLAAVPQPTPKPQTPEEQAALTLEQLRAERDARMDQAQEAFQTRVEAAGKARDAAVTKARQDHDAIVTATRAWYDQRRSVLEAQARRAMD